MENNTSVQQQTKKQRGYTLLEYCAGAAILAGVIAVGMSTMGTNMNTAFSRIGTWAVARTDSLTGSSSSTGN